MTSASNGQDEDQSNKNEMIQKFVNNFVENFNSYISNLFFGISKEKKLVEIAKCSDIILDAFVY